MRIGLFILASIAGLLNAYMLGVIDQVNDEENIGFEAMLVLMGKTQLEEQKSYVYKFVGFSVLIHLPYLLLSLFYFYGELIPFLLSILLVLSLMIEIGVQIKQIKQAQTIDEAVQVNTKFGKVLMFLNMAIYAIHIAYLL